MLPCSCSHWWALTSHALQMQDCNVKLGFLASTNRRKLSDLCCRWVYLRAMFGFLQEKHGPHTRAGWMNLASTRAWAWLYRKNTIGHKISHYQLLYFMYYVRFKYPANGYISTVYTVPWWIGPRYIHIILAEHRSSSRIGLEYRS